LLELIRGYDYGEFDGMKISKPNRECTNKDLSSLGVRVPLYVYFRDAPVLQPLLPIFNIL
jgi:hypothetical protein